MAFEFQVIYLVVFPVQFLFLFLFFLSRIFWIIVIVIIIVFASRSLYIIRAFYLLSHNTFRPGSIILYDMI